MSADSIAVFHANQIDPTRTKTRRKRFQRTFGSRLRAIRGANRRFLEREDYPVQRARAIDRYRSFITQTTNEELVEPAPRRMVRLGNHWTGSFVRDAYQKGLELAERFLDKAGYPEDDVRRAVRSSSQPHNETRQMQFLRAFMQTEDLGQRLIQATTRVVSEGITAQQPFRELASESNSEIRGNVSNNANSVGNTVIVATVNQAALTAYREANVEAVGVQVEAETETPIEQNYIRVNAAGEVFWQTAMDGAVCPDCLALEGVILEISRITGQPQFQPPIHPNCRCILVPMPTEVDGEVLDPAGVFGGPTAVQQGS